MKPRLLLILLFFSLFPSPAFSSIPEHDSMAERIARLPVPNQAAFYASIWPGAGHLYLHQTVTGYSIMAGGLGLLSLYIWDDLKIRNSGSPEKNVPLYIFDKYYSLQVFSAYREARYARPDILYQYPVDMTPMGDLLLAPFKWENISSPFVWGMALVSGGALWASYSLNRPVHDYTSIRRMQMFGDFYPHDPAIGAYELVWTGFNISVAAGEESLFRGYLQNEFQESFGEFGGLSVSSITFGSLHYFNGTTVQESLGNVAFATAAGYYLGWLYQHENYKLSRSIAAHFWWNQVAAALGFLYDPSANPLGFKVDFNY